MEPGVKLIITLIYLIAVISVNPQQVSLLLSFLWYPALGVILGEIPFITIGRTLRLAMPFALFAGLSNLVFNREIAFTILKLLYVLIGFKVPTIIVTQIMMTYRYISIITEEGYTMYQAYILRAPREKGIKLKDMGPFLGQLMIRSFDRAERVYQAMKCRGFKGYITFSRRNEISGKGWLYILIIGGILIILRLVNIPLLLGEILL
ncbi:MAG: cbiQ2 [Anaerocolumna sp.]|nr:cbiQ2 [Anaerocolumna sp.]